MKRSSVALLVTVLLTALLGVTPASASSPLGHRTYAQATPVAPTASPATRRSSPASRQGPILAAPGPAGMGRQATATPQATLPAALPAVGTAWANLGPRPIVPPAQVSAFTYGNVSGRVTALAVDPSSPSTVYAGTAGGGVWKTIDAGTTWAPMTDGQVSAGIGAIAIDPADHLIVYAATGEDNACVDICPPSRGVLKTTDGGASWAMLGAATFDTAAANTYFFFGSIAVDSSAHSHVIAATNQGLYNSIDGGTSWTHTTSLESAATRVAAATPAIGVMQALQDTVLPNRWWAAVSDWCTTEVGDVMVSVDSGATWNASRTFSDISGGAERISIAVGPGTGGSTVYAEVSGCNSPVTSGGNGPYRFVQGSGWSNVGETTTNVMNPPNAGGAQGFWANTIAVDPGNASHVLVGGTTVISSTDPTTVGWTDVGRVYSGGSIHPDFHAFAFAPAGGIAYAANDGGIWKTADLGANWTNLNATLQLTQYYAGFAKDLNTFAGGSQDNGTSARYPGAPAAPALGLINGGDGGWAQFRSGTQYYTQAQNNDMQIVDTSLLASNPDNATENGPCNNPNTGTPSGPSCNDRKGFPLTPFVTSPTVTDTLYSATYRVWRSGNGGLPAGGGNWVPISGDLTLPTTPASDYIAFMATRSIGGHDVVVTASQAGRMYMSTNAETGSPTWTNITGDLPVRTTGNSIPFNAFVPAIAINPSNQSEIWVALGSLTLGRVWHTVNAGAATNWTDLSGSGLGGLPVAITKSIAVNPKLPSNLVVGTDAGVFICFTCGGAAVPSWSLLGTGLPNSRVQFLSTTDDGVNLVAWTHGRGAWTIPLPLDSLAVGTSTAAPTAGTAFDVTVSAKRPDNTTDTSYRGTIHFTSSDPGSPTLPADYTFTSGDNGSHTFTSGATLRTTGNQTITATDTVTAIITGTSATLGVVATVPSAPTIGTAVAGNASATLTWTAPAFNGGAAITGYRVTPFIGTTAQSPVLTGSTATSFVVTGLANGTAYTFTVGAMNGAGTGPDSSHSNSITPISVASAPTGVTGTAGNGQVALTWSAPASNGGSAITGYRVTPFIGTTAQSAILTGSTLTNYTVTGLINGTAYTFTVAAINGAGTGPDSSPSSALVPFTVAGAPTAVAGSAGNGQVGLNWTPPASNGGSAITGYRVTPYMGTTAQAAILTGSSLPSYTVTGLINGTAYTFTVAAINGAGPGTDSSPSSSVVPFTVAGAPTGVAGTPGGGQVALTWSAPASNGGSAITGYRVTPFIGTTAQSPVLTGSALTSYTVTGLTSGSTYTFTVAAINAAGAGTDSSPSSSITLPVLESLGGVLIGAPAVTSWASNRTDVFVRGSDSGLYHRTWNGSSWSTWESLGGVMTASPAAVSWGPNRIDVFVRGVDNALYRRSWTGSAWGGWESLGGGLTAGPDVASWGPNRLDVFVRGSDNGLWHRAWSGAGWDPWESLGGGLTADPAAVSWGPNHIDVFVRGTDNALWQRTWTGSWSAWNSLGGGISSAPAASSCASQHLDVYVLGGGSVLWQRGYNGTSWSAWKSVGSQWTADPASVCRTGTQVVDLFFRGTDAALWHTVANAS